MSDSIRRVVLVGLPGSGKSTVGRLLAQYLHWRFVDLDTEIERTAGASVAEIFARFGEAEFRRLEQELTGAVASMEDVVLAPGGGWIMQPAARVTVAGSISIWLRVAPSVALERLRLAEIDRPLLQVDDPLQRLRELLQERTHFYAQADVQFETDAHTADAVARSLFERLRTMGMRA